MKQRPLQRGCVARCHGDTHAVVCQNRVGKNHIAIVSKSRFGDIDPAAIAATVLRDGGVQQLGRGTLKVQAAATAVACTLLVAQIVSADDWKLPQMLGKDRRGETIYRAKPVDDRFLNPWPEEYEAEFLSGSLITNCY